MFKKKPPTVRIGTSRVGGGNLPTNAKRESVLRTDIGCGFRQCKACAEHHERSAPAVLDASKNTMIPDANVLLLYSNLFEESNEIANVIFLSSVLADVQKKNKTIYSRIQKVTLNQERGNMVFSNMNHSQTSATRKDDESETDFETRCVRVAAAWYTRHLEAVHAAGSGGESKVYLVTHSEKRKQELEDEGYSVLTFKEYVSATLSEESALLERIQAVGEVSGEWMLRGAESYTPYLSEAELLSGIDNGSLLKGKLKVGESSCFFGDIRGKWNFGGNTQNVPALAPQTDRVLIAGKFPMNRAVADDIVAVQPLPFDQWRYPPGTKKGNGTGPTSLEEAIADKCSPTGRIVGIIQPRRRPYCGSIQVEDIKKYEGTTGSVSVLVQPKSNRIPRIRIQTRQLEQLKDKRLSVVIDEWPENSAFPLGHYVDVLGKIGDKETEAKVILIENDIPHYDFSQAVYDCLPKGDWKVEEAEEQVRLDLRSYTICSVDPLGCRDIDDALHWRQLEDGNVEVGVHIADVTHFLREDTAMDEEAQKRSTSVYLVDRRINMLPQLLTENLCSIVGNEDRYAFSIIWVFEKGTTKVVKEWFGKTIIRSRAALYYGDAQRMIDDVNDNSDIALSLKGLMSISQKLKEARTEAGALFLASQEFKFKTDDEHLNPTDMTKYQTFEANSMIEEWMLFANVAAARRIHQVFPRWALLRRHQAPDPLSFASINEALKEKLNKVLDPSSSLTLNRSMDQAIDPNDPFFNELVRMLTTRCLRQAQYISSGEVPYEEYHHYGLAMPIYTHFTSPIRRYSDVIVHRQLAATLKIMEVSEHHTNVERINTIAENLNYRHEQAQKAGRDSKNLFTGFYLRNFPDGNVPPEIGYVIKITDTQVFVLVPRYGQESKIEREEVKDVEKYKVFDRVTVGINLKQAGDVLRTKLVFSVLGGPEVLEAKGEHGHTEVDEDLVEALVHEGEGHPERKTQKSEEDVSSAIATGESDERTTKKQRLD